ncbi:hypothetical protein [Sporomusa acidovorans]|uniref:Restriction endonuclease type IV Mrr domain-containing protein n=1 Tax=Sporomusa acidovorans (strain ATCC 49682 / DSM 3132 / Mol) TaxID=1123286 RepID=A0ABZ3IZF6_SPOA4|nr:hypothetical protein [Sporomusa acidovorans]OZC19216.1 hypothetical protein SPACI_33020 [Sporomusa acidovorans DSM 3132]SDF10678.1 hypothetical protein SAMN04488499_10332 [Sporomusa acidovorans]
MVVDKVTWEQFSACTNDTRGIRYRFEDLCRQLFEYEFLSGNKVHKYVHSNPNNAGLESEPIYDETNQRRIGYQVKFFDNGVDYGQIQHSAEKIVQYYKGQVEHVYIFSNKAITADCQSYKKVVEILADANISTELITDTTVLDIVRKYHNLSLYYFGQNYVNREWFELHTKEILAKLGERYNDELNVDTKAALELSLFLHDESAVRYLNDKKTHTIDLLAQMNWKYDKYETYKEKVEVVVKSIGDVTQFNILEAIGWNDVIQNRLKDEVEKFRININKISEEREMLLSDIQKVENEEKRKKIWNKISNLRDEMDVFETLIGLSDSLKLTDKEMELLSTKILIVEGNAGVGKSHLLANETMKLLANNRKALMLVGGDYLDNNPILEQIRSNMFISYSFFELIDLLNIDGENSNCVIPIFIDAINETWNTKLWKPVIPLLFNKIRELENVRLVLSFRSEYRKVLLGEGELKGNDVCNIVHRGFAEESFQATQIFLNYYGIPFTPLQMFNHSITNPLFLTLYCKTYQGDDIDFPVLYERILSVANDNIHKNMTSALTTAGYDVCDDVVAPVILSLADHIIKTGHRYFSKDEISDLSIWKTNGIVLQPFVQNLVRENILHNYLYGEEERLYFAYDQMNDYYCAKAILKKCASKEELRKYIEEHVLALSESRQIKYENRDIFIYICILYAEKYGDECIDIIDKIEEDCEREDLFAAYIDSFQSRKCHNVTTEQFFDMCNKYKAQPEKVWDMLIGNSLKLNCNFNADALHEVLMAYPLNKRDYLWTEYINGLEFDSENRLIQLIKMYNEGNGLAFSGKKQLELLLTLLGWLLTSSSRWLRDTTAKAMVEIIKNNFFMSEILLKKFEMVNDPYVIQRLYGIVWGACVKRKDKNKIVFETLAAYIYNHVFQSEFVYPDILMRDYARLTMERFLYEFPEEESHYLRSLIEPPYVSKKIPKINEQGYLDGSYGSGLYQIIHSMKFEGMGMYGDFGRYTFQSALRDFEVDHKQIFNYAIYFIINDLGYDDELFGDYDNSLGGYNYNRHTTAKVERIGKKYQWISMYNILARIADHCERRDYYSDEELQKYDGPWDPYVRDFDPSLNEFFMKNEDFPIFGGIKVDEESFKGENEKMIHSKKDGKKWIEEYPEFFDYQKGELITKDENGKEWVVLLKYADTNRKKAYKEKVQTWNWIYDCTAKS